MASLPAGDAQPPVAQLETSSSVRAAFEAVSRKTHKWSNYFEVYDRLFTAYRGRQITLIEVGVMNGGSLQMWRRYFGVAARIIGVDLNPAAVTLADDGFEIFVGDQADAAFWRSLFSQVGDVDIVVDDGGHTNLQQIVTAVEAIPHIRDGGLLVTEDTHTSYMGREFGNPSSFSFISFAKHVVDIVNSRSPLVDRAAADSRSLGSAVYSLEFFDSFVVFHIDRQGCRRPTLESAGTIVFTDRDDRQPWLARFRSGVRSIRRFLPGRLGTPNGFGRRIVEGPLRVVGRIGAVVTSRRTRSFFD